MPHIVIFPSVCVDLIRRLQTSSRDFFLSFSSSPCNSSFRYRLVIVERIRDFDFHAVLGASGRFGACCELNLVMMSMLQLDMDITLLYLLFFWLILVISLVSFVIELFFTVRMFVDLLNGNSGGGSFLRHRSSFCSGQIWA